MNTHSLTEARPVERGHEYLEGLRVKVCWRTDCDHKTRPLAPVKRRAFPALAVIEARAS